MEDGLISNTPSDAMMLAVQASPEEAQAILEAIAAEALKLEAEKQQAMDQLAAEIETTLRQRMSQRSQKENEWTLSRDLHMGSLATPIYRPVFPEPGADSASSAWA
jgi:hypothetical protein